jgi:predicted XRE-type DNA-binding protein
MSNELTQTNNNIRLLVSIKNISQNKIADLLCVKQSAVSPKLGKPNRKFSFEQAKIVAEDAGYTIEDLLYDNFKNILLGVNDDPK